MGHAAEQALPPGGWLRNILSNGVMTSPFSEGVPSKLGPVHWLWLFGPVSPVSFFSQSLSNKPSFLTLALRPYGLPLGDPTYVEYSWPASRLEPHSVSVVSCFGAAQACLPFD